MIRQEIVGILRSHLMEFGYEYDFVVEIPEEQFGDFSTNIALVGAKYFKKPPKEIAKDFVEKFSGHRMFKEVTIAGPGFINFKVSNEFYRDFLTKFIQNPYSVWNFKRHGSILMEYGSANPTGPLTVGHGRQVVIGDVLGNVFKFTGWEVTKEMYLNDAGRQIRLLAKSVWARYNQLLGYDEPIPEDGYNGEYVVDIARHVIADHNDEYFKIWNDDVESVFKSYALNEISRMFDTTLEKIGANFDNVFKESSLVNDGTVKEVLTILESKGLVYEEDGALWFRASRFVNDNDKVLIKNDGSYTYFLTDIAYHYKKYKRGYNIAVDIFGSDHHGHLPRMYAAMKALDIPEDFLMFVLHQFVTLKRGDEIVKMSTRAGEFVTLDELIDEVGKDAARYFFAMVDVNTHLNFDLELAKSKTDENPVFYVQYAHARISSLFENAKAKGINFIPRENIELLENESEMRIIKQISLFDEILERVTEKLSPHYLADYLEKLASLFHKYYAENKIVDTDNMRLSNARLNLAFAVRRVLSEGLNLIGISALERM